MACMVEHFMRVCLHKAAQGGSRTSGHVGLVVRILGLACAPMSARRCHGLMRHGHRGCTRAA
jgi:hypothetical protein